MRNIINRAINWKLTNMGENKPNERTIAVKVWFEKLINELQNIFKHSLFCKSR